MELLAKSTKSTWVGVTLLIDSRKRAIRNCWHAVEEFVKGKEKKKKRPEIYVEASKKVSQTDRRK